MATHANLLYPNGAISPAAVEAEIERTLGEERAKRLANGWADDELLAKHMAFRRTVIAGWIEGDALAQSRPFVEDMIRREYTPAEVARMAELQEQIDRTWVADDRGAAFLRLAAERERISMAVRARAVARLNAEAEQAAVRIAAE